MTSVCSKAAIPAMHAGGNRPIRRPIEALTGVRVGAHMLGGALVVPSGWHVRRMPPSHRQTPPSQLAMPLSHPHLHSRAAVPTGHPRPMRPANRSLTPRHTALTTGFVCLLLPCHYCLLLPYHSCFLLPYVGSVLFCSCVLASGVGKVGFGWLVG